MVEVNKIRKCLFTLGETRSEIVKKFHHSWDTVNRACSRFYVALNTLSYWSIKKQVLSLITLPCLIAGSANADCFFKADWIGLFPPFASIADWGEPLNWFLLGVADNPEASVEFPNSAELLIFKGPPNIRVNGIFKVCRIQFIHNDISFKLAPFGAPVSKLVIFDSIHNNAAPTIINSDIVVASNIAIRVLSNSDLTLSGRLEGGNSVTISSSFFATTGTGKVILSGAGSTFTGTIIVTDGRLELSGPGSIGTANLTIAPAGRVTISPGAGTKLVETLSGAGPININDNTLQVKDGVYSGVISGTGSLIKTNSETLTLIGTNSYSGGTTVSEGTLEGTTDGLQGNIINNGGVTFEQPETGISGGGFYSGVMSGSGTLTKNGKGPVTFDNVNSYSGITIINDGLLKLSGVGTISDDLIITGNGIFEIASGVKSIETLFGGPVAEIKLNGSVLFIKSGSFSGAISGTGGDLAKSGSDTLFLSGPNNYSGGTTVFDGTLEGTTDSLQGAINNQSLVIFNQPLTGIFGNGIYSGVMIGSGALSKIGEGTVILNKLNSYSGITIITAGTLELSGPGTLGNVSPLTVNAPGSFVIAPGPSTKTIGALNGAGGEINLNNNTLEVPSGSFSGDILGTNGSLNKISGGTLIRIKYLHGEYFGECRTVINH